MSNLGLKPYTKQLTSQVGNITGYVNLNKRDGNLILDIPVISSTKVCPINLSLIYNYQNSTTSSIYGNGVRLNYDRLAKQSMAFLRLYRADGTVEGFMAEDNNLVLFKNEETLHEIHKITSSDLECGYYYLLKDKYGNESKYNPDDMTYPYEIKTKTNDLYTIENNESNVIIKNKYYDKVTINVIESVITFEYTFVDEINGFTRQGYKTILYLDENNNISKIDYKMYNSETENYESYKILHLSITSSEILLNDDLSNQNLVYSLTNGLVTSIKEYIIVGTEKVTSINYISNYKTVVTNNINEKEIYYFDEYCLPINVIDNRGFVLGTKYKNTTKLLTSSFGPISLKNDNNNYLYQEGLVDFDGQGVTILPASSSDEDLSQYINSDLYKATGTGTLTFNVKQTFIETDVLTMCMCVKNLSVYSESQYVKVQLLNDDEICSEYISKNNSILENYEFVTMSAAIKHNTSSIQIKISFVGNASIEIGNILLFKEPYERLYDYDESKNLLEVVLGSTSQELEYNEDNQIKQISNSDSSKSQKVYNSNKLLTKTKEHYDVEVDYEYDSYNNVNKKIIKSPHKNGKLVSKQDYIYGSLTSVKDYNLLQNEVFEKNYDMLGRVQTVNDKINKTTTYYLYENDKLRKLQLRDSNNSYTNYLYEYYDNKMLKKIACPDGLVYTFEYNEYNNLTTVKYNDSILESYEYDNLNNLITKVSHSGNCGFRYTYNDKLLLDKVYEITSSEIEELKYQYEYDDNDQVTRIKDSSDNVLIDIVYDKKGKVLKISESSCESSYTYDHLNYLNSEMYKNDYQSIYQSYDTFHRSKGANPENMDSYFKQQNSMYVATFIDDVKAKCYSSELTPVYTTASSSDITFDKTYDGIVPCLELSSAVRLRYTLNTAPLTEIITGSIGFWFKKELSVATKNYLFSSKRENRNSFIGVYIKNNYLFLEAIDDNGVYYDLCCSEYPIKENEWNFFALSFENRSNEDTQDSFDACQYTLILNSHTTKFTKSNPRLYVELDLCATYNIGCKYNGITYSDYFTGKISSLFIGPNKYTNVNTILEFYKITKDYLIDNQFNDENTNSVDFSVGRFSEFLNTNVEGYKIFEYHNKVDSLDGIKPTCFNKRQLLNIDKDRTFNFNNKIKDYAFVSDGNQLKYDFNFDTIGTIMLRVLFDVYNDKQYIFELKDNNENVLALYRNNEQSLVIEFNGVSKITDFAINNNDEWNNIGLSFNQQIAADSTESNGYTFRVYLNGNYYEYFFETAATIKGGTLSVGAKHDLETVEALLSTYDTYYPLYGLIEYMIVKEDSYLSISTLDDLSSLLNVSRKVSFYDEVGLLTKTETLVGDTSVVFNEYEYQTKTIDDEIYLSNIVSKERMKTNDDLDIDRTYVIDDLGRITDVNDPYFGNYEYTYNDRGFLIEEKHSYNNEENKFEEIVEYKYDSNGNILSKGDNVFFYNNGKLIKVNNDEVIYDENNDLLIKQIGSVSYTYQNNKLSSVYNSNKNIKVDFTYNYCGLRESKTVYNLSSNTSFTTHYKYSGSKLIREESSGHCIDYMYDEKDILYGFIFNNQEKYYYIRDVTGLILGITLQTGEVVVKYEYDAWGKIVSINDTSRDYIGTSNPFIYKGYYYDVETGWFWLSSRYYSPELCRFISPDDIEYLDPESVNGLNLYCYCKNNPIMYKDNSGHYPEWATFSNLFEGTSTALQLMLNGAYIGGYFSVVNAVRPNNIGIGIWNKQRTAAINSFADDVKALDKFGKIMSGITVAIQVGEGVFNDYNRGYSLDRIISNAAVNTIVYGVSAWGLAQIGGMIGNLIPIPIVGSLIGTAAGYLLGLGINYLMDLEINGKSLIDHARDFVYDLWTNIFD